MKSSSQARNKKLLAKRKQPSHWSDNDLKWACEQFRIQQGRGWYSNLPLMVDHEQGWWKPSPERLDDGGTYTHDNTVLECLEFNGNQAKWSTALFKQFFCILD